MKYEIFIPFPGFYESILDRCIDCEIENIGENDAENDPSVGPMQRQELIATICDFSKVHLKAAQFWVRRFCQWILAESDHADVIALSFKELISPREYNFTTDRILCETSEQAIYHMMATVTPMTLSDHAAKRHTSRSGFLSFYSPDIRTWPEDVKEWDCNQLQTLLEAWVLDNVADAAKWIDSVTELMYEDWDDCLDAGMDWQRYNDEVSKLKPATQENCNG